MIDVQEIRHKSIKGVMSYALRTLVLQAIGFVATLLLGYYLTPADFGIYFIVTSVISIFTFLSDIGLAAALVQKKEEPTVTELRTTFTVQQILAVFIFVMIIILSPIWKGKSSLNDDGMMLLYALGFSFILASIKTIPSILLERKLEFGKLVLPQVVENILFYVIAVVLASKGFGVRSYTYAVLMRSIGGIVTMYAIQRWPIGFAFSKQAFKGLMRFGLKFQLNDFLARLKDDLFIVVLARFVPAAEMGYISWAKRWSMFPYQFSVNSVMSVTFPTFSRLQDDKDKLKRGIEKSIFFVTLVIFPVLAGLCVIALPLTEILPKYQKWQPALPSLYFFCINIAWAAVSTPLTNTLNAIGKIDKTLKLMIMWTILTWTVTPVTFYLFGFTGVAIASAIIASSSIVTVWMLSKHVKFNFFDQVWRQIVASVVMTTALVLTQTIWQSSIFTLGVAIFFGACMYTITLMSVGYKKVRFEIATLGLFRRRVA